MENIAISGVKLVHESVFKPFETLPGDKIEFNYKHKDKVVVSHMEHIKKGDKPINCVRVYYFAEFDGLENAYVMVAGFKK